MTSTAALVAGFQRLHQPFTAAQWQELEQQALIYKYMVAGIPVPPELLLSIRRSVASSGFPNCSNLNCSSVYGKKIDPEPGRCRRTDGKKWRCSKDAYPESRYCERHMNRARNRSRKPVEMPNTSLFSSSSGVAANAGMGAFPSNFPNFPSNSSISFSQGGHTSSLQRDHSSPYGIVNKNYRYLNGTRGEGDQHSLCGEGSLNPGGLGLGDGSWPLNTSDWPVFASAKDQSSSIWDHSCQQIQSLHTLDAVTVCAAPSKQQQQCFFGDKVGSLKPTKQGRQSLRPFFDDWPKIKDSWTDSGDEEFNEASLPKTQLSISMPVISSRFAGHGSHDG